MNVMIFCSFFPSYSDLKDRRWILAAGCISKNILTHIAMMLNFAP